MYGFCSTDSSLGSASSSSYVLEDEMSSNYELNTVEETEFEDMLTGAEILGDLPEEIDFE